MKVFVFLAVVCMWVGGNEGSGSFRVNVLLRSFSNPDNRTLRGVECDGPDLLSPDCTLGFKICVEAYNSQNYTYNATSCSTGWRDTGYLNSFTNNVTFLANTKYGQWSNPSVYYFNQKYSAVTLKLQARDKSPMTPWAHDVVDNYVHIIQKPMNTDGLIEIQHPRQSQFHIQPTTTVVHLDINCITGYPPSCQSNPTNTTTLSPTASTAPPHNPCANGGTWMFGYCICAPGFWGRYCHNRINGTNTTTASPSPTGVSNITTITTSMPSNHTCGHGILFGGECYCQQNYCGVHCNKHCLPSESVTLPTFVKSSNAEDDLMELCEQLLTTDKEHSDAIIRICHPRIDQIMSKVETQKKKLSGWKSL